MLKTPKLRISVGRRLLALILTQAFATLVLMGLAVYFLHRISLGEQYMYRFQFQPIEDLSSTLETTTRLQSLVAHEDSRNLGEAERQLWMSLAKDLRSALTRYRKQWQTANNTDEDARRFRKELSELGQLDLLDEEISLMRALDQSLQSIEEEHRSESRGEVHRSAEWDRVRDFRGKLVELLQLNMNFAQIAHKQVQKSAGHVQFYLIAIWTTTMLSLLLMGLMVHRAIAPRIRNLVQKVRHFQEFGVNEKILDRGEDEIAILANALDTGLAAIADRERDRESFLAIAAHELKTPTASIQGFSTMLLTYRDQPAILDKALVTIQRQSWRLSRLVESLFLAINARSGTLKFQPSPLDLSVLVKRIVAEVEPFLPDQAFALKIQDHVNILGDEALLSHGVWNLLTCASALSAPESPLVVQLVTSETKVQLSVKADDSYWSTEDIESLFAPFRFVEYERGVGARNAVGLYLCREIAKIHNGRLSAVSNETQRGILLTMELPL